MRLLEDDSCIRSQTCGGKVELKKVRKKFDLIADNAPFKVQHPPTWGTGWPLSIYLIIL